MYYNKDCPLNESRRHNFKSAAWVLNGLILHMYMRKTTWKQFSIVLHTESIFCPIKKTNHSYSCCQNDHIVVFETLIALSCVICVEISQMELLSHEYWLSSFTNKTRYKSLPTLLCCCVVTFTETISTASYLRLGSAKMKTFTPAIPVDK